MDSGTDMYFGLPAGGLNVELTAQKCARCESHWRHFQHFQTLKADLQDDSRQATTYATSARSMD